MIGISTRLPGTMNIPDTRTFALDSGKDADRNEFQVRLDFHRSVHNFFWDRNIRRPLFGSVGKELTGLIASFQSMSIQPKGICSDSMTCKDKDLMQMSRKFDTIPPTDRRKRSLIHPPRNHTVTSRCQARCYPFLVQVFLVITLFETGDNLEASSLPLEHADLMNQNVFPTQDFSDLPTLIPTNCLDGHSRMHMKPC